MKGSVITLTANKRLARILREDKQNQNAWITPKILPLKSWLMECWNLLLSRGVDVPLMLNSFQVELLWRDIVSKNLDESVLLANTSVKLFVSAWELLRQWNISLDDFDECASLDSEVFKKCALEFILVCKKNNWLDYDSAVYLLAEQFAAKTLEIPEKIFLNGFIELTPAYENLFSILANLGCKVEFLKKKNTLPANAYRVKVYSNTEEEIKKISLWAENILQQNPGARIGCVVPNLKELRSVFERAFAPLEFNVSAGISFAKEPIIYSAFEILKFCSQEISIADLKFIITSPYISDYLEKHSQRFLLAASLHEQSRQKWNIKTFTGYIDLHKEFDTGFGEIIEALNLLDYSRKQTPNAWIKIFWQILQVFGWPNVHNKLELIAAEQFAKILHELGAANILMQKISYFEALNYLKDIAGNIIFQPIKNINAPIQILGTLEAIDLPFDHLWVMGMDNQTWPLAAKPNTLIPIRLQKKINSPHSSAEREYSFCKQVTEKLLQQADDIVVSYSRFDEDREVDLSPLFVRSDVPINFETICEPILFFDDNVYESITDANANPIMDDEKISGGVAILQEQAKCPFKAFCEFRLHAKSFDEIESGIDAKTKGNILHFALEHIWKKIESHKNLCELSDEELRKIITANIFFALKKYVANFSEKLLELEKKRLLELIFSFLQVEKNRDFFEVIATEQKLATQIGKLPINLRIDRIDKNNFSQHILIDYKTGKTELKKWFDSRMDEPQLPLYATAYADSVCSIAFAQVRAGEIEFKSISKNKGILPNDKTISDVHYENSQTNWNEQLISWRLQLEQLANEFYDGVAKVMPKNQETCRYCKLKSCCRVWE